MMFTYSLKLLSIFCILYNMINYRKNFNVKSKFFIKFHKIYNNLIK